MHKWIAPAVKLFLSTLPQGERHERRTVFVLYLHFYPRSRKGSDAVGRILRLHEPGISIHAPARGATKLEYEGGVIWEISIHAPARGATFCLLQLLSFCGDFYPRSRKGSDLRLPISKISSMYFYPRSRKGSDNVYPGISGRIRDFYPRSRKGSDRGN